MNEISTQAVLPATGVGSRTVNTIAPLPPQQTVQPPPKAEGDVKQDDKDKRSDVRKDPLEALSDLLTSSLGELPANLRLQIDLDDDAQRFVYKSVDRDTGEIVRQFPSDELLKLIAAVREATGIAVDVSA